MVVGYSKLSSILEAFVGRQPVLEDDEIGYLYDLEYILIEIGGGSVLMGSSWILNQATGVALNDDLTARIVGWGVNLEGGIEAWLADVFPYGELESLLTHE